MFSTLDPEALRSRAEALARQDQTGPVGVGESGGPDALKQTLHALHVYQIELEMQNDELRQAQIKLEIQNEELRQFQIDLKVANVRYFDFYDLAPVAYCTLDTNGLILELNLTAAKMLGVPKKRLLKQMFSRFVRPQEQDVFYLYRRDILESGAARNCELQLIGQETGEFSASLIGLAAPDAQGAKLMRIVFSDVTARKQIEKELRASEERFRLMFDRATDGIVILSDSGTLLAVNDAFAQMHGYTRDEMLSMNLRDLDTPETLHELASRLERVFAGESLTFEVTHYHKDGRVLILEVSSSLIAVGGERVIQAFHRDITERRQTEELVRELAYYDPLTGLANRMLLKDRLTQSMLAGQRSGNYGALMFLDLDNFKPLNDQHGHGAGDLLLVEVAKRLKSCVRQIDTVARFGGDEFVVLLDDLPSDQAQAQLQADLVAEKIRRTLASSHALITESGGLGTLQTIEHKCTASIGVALFLGMDNTINDVFKWADLAMYRAKDSGRNTVCYFDSKMLTENTARLVLAEDLRNAVLKQQFCVYYQAQFDRGNHVVGADALLRWQHPSRGWVSPCEFIPKAERTGLILPMGLWVLESACSQLALWAQREQTADLTVTVNVSDRQLAQCDFVDQVMATLERTGATPERLRIEMKESVLLADVEGVLAKMNALKDKGVGFSLDDFGNGYSSLTNLNRVPLDQIKIDRSFVRGILTDPDDAAVARMVVALAHSLGVVVIAEGVETEAQRDFLASLGCHTYQGYLFSPAVSAHEFEALVSRTPT